MRATVGALLATLPDDLTPNRWPAAPASLAAFGLHVLGQGDYHRGFRWSHVGCLWAAALLTLGAGSPPLARDKRCELDMIDAGSRTLARYARALEEHGTLHEVFEPFSGGAPVRRSFYSSETSFSMAIGPYLLAQSIATRLCTARPG